MNTFSLQTRLYSGQGSLAVLKRFTNKHIWIICDGFLARSPLLDTLRNALPADNRISVFSEITPDPTIHTVVQGIAQMQALQPQVVIGLAAARQWTRQKRLSGLASKAASISKLAWRSRPPAAPARK